MASKTPDCENIAQWPKRLIHGSTTGPGVNGDLWMIGWYSSWQDISSSERTYTGWGREWTTCLCIVARRTRRNTRFLNARGGRRKKIPGSYVWLFTECGQHCANYAKIMSSKEEYVNRGVGRWTPFGPNLYCNCQAQFVILSFICVLLYVYKCDTFNILLLMLYLIICNFLFSYSSFKITELDNSGSARDAWWYINW